MEDWLNDSSGVEYNLSASGCQDFYLGDFLASCHAGIDDFNNLFLGDNDTRGSLRLRQAICRSYERVELQEVMVSNGSSEALFIFFNELLEHGDEVVIPFPAFQCLYQVPLSIGCKVRFLPLLECENWRLDINRLSRMVNRNTRLIIINNPHNPMGWTLSREELREIGCIARENGCYLMFDEHYRYLSLQPGTELIPSGFDVCKEINDKTFATGSMIKCFGIVGIRIGWFIGDPAFLARCRDYKDYITHTIPSVTDHIASTALENKDILTGIQKDRILPNLDLLDCFMKRNREVFQYVRPTGGVVCFPRLKNKQSSETFCLELRETYGVSLLPGYAFEVGDHFRINFGLDHEKFRSALERVREYIDK
jgi:aspartate/methionine/tyrosine aminotransferase